MVIGFSALPAEAPARQEELKTAQTVLRHYTTRQSSCQLQTMDVEALNVGSSQHCKQGYSSSIHSIIHSGDLYSTSSRDYYSEALQAQSRTKK